MKIVYFIDHLRGDGTQRALRQLARGLAQRGHLQTVVCMNDQTEEAITAPLRAARVTMRVVGKEKWLRGRGFFETYRWLRDERFDVGVTLLYVSDLVGRPMLRAAQVPRIVSSLRARNVNYPPLKRALTRVSMPLAQQVVLNTATVREFAIAGEGVSRKQIVVIPNGICVDEYIAPMSRAQLAGEFNIPFGAQVIGSVGRLAPQKGFDVLLRAFAGLDEMDAYLLLIGQGDEDGNLRAFAGELGISERVRFAGYRRDVPRLLGALNVYVHPARFEGMPNAVMEAMAAGRPIVATAVDGTTELLRDGVDAWLVPPDDADALRGALDEALANQPQAHARGKSAQARAIAQFSEKAMVDAWERVLRGA